MRYDPIEELNREVRWKLIRPLILPLVIYVGLIVTGAIIVDNWDDIVYYAFTSPTLGWIFLSVGIYGMYRVFRKAIFL